VCLAYACDDKADQIDGLAALGPAWIHGAILPLYVGLRDFCADKSVFPDTPEAGKARCLLNYLRKTTDSFAPELEQYLMNEDVPVHGTILILDGLDEVYKEEDRFILQRIIENWADRFPTSRILVTSRTYAYRHDSQWRLSERFASAELAPFTWKQIQIYIDNWYSQAALSRASVFGGHAVAAMRTQKMAQDLKRTIIETTPLWPLARQPLMLSLLTLIHEDHKRLPEKKAALYEQTVELLDRWNIPSPADQLHEKLSHLNLDRMRAALKLLAFDLQKQQQTYQLYPATITQQELLHKLSQQQMHGNGLGAYIEDVLEYIATRNGILVSDKQGLYRFPHLSIQEYLAACALIELYDECDMPDVMREEYGVEELLTFPANVAALMRADPYRWRNTTIFAGSIIAMGKGQDRRWDLIDELLNRKKDETISENILHTIYVTAEIWSESWLKARTRTQKKIQENLLSSLKDIQHDERLDAPERAKITRVLGHLQIGV
jgi:hypothetical protein